MIRLLLLAMALALAPAVVPAQTGSISGTCSLPDTSDWSGITVAIEGKNLSVQTDGSGSYELSGIPAGTVRLRVGKLYYADTAVTVNVPPGREATLNLALSTRILDTLAGMRTPRFSTASTNTGNIGLPNVYLTEPDSGFRWGVVQQLKEGAFMTGVSTSQVSDAARTIFGITQDFLDHDFESRSGIVTRTDGPDSTVHETAYDDSRSNEPPGFPTQPMGIAVTERTSVYGAPGEDGFLLIELTIRNTTRFTLSNFLAGWFLDWEVGGTGSTNRGAVITARQEIPGFNQGHPFITEIAFQQAATGTGPYMGIVPLSQSMFRAARIASVSREIAATVSGGGMTEARKYAYLRDRRADSTAATDFGAGEDLATIVSVGGFATDTMSTSAFTLGPGDQINVGFALAGGNTMEAMTANALAAQRKWVARGHEMLIVPSMWRIDSGWRMVSVPLRGAERSKRAIFPSAESSAFRYQHGTGYLPADSLDPGIGYWVKMPADTVITMAGEILRADTIDVAQGWNMVGALTFSAPVAEIETVPADIIASSFYAFREMYVGVDTLEPAQGYWVKCRQAGKIIVKSR